METEKKTYMVFVIQAHDGETPDMRLMNVTQLELISSTPEDAIRKAKKLILKKFYRLSMVVEKHYGST